MLDKKIDSRETYFKSLAKQVVALEDLIRKINNAWNSIDGAKNETQRKRSTTRFKNYEGNLAPIFKKCCLKLKVFEDFIQRLNPEIKAIARNLAQPRIGQERFRQGQAQGREDGSGKEGTPCCQTKFQMAPEELIALIKNFGFLCAKLIERKPKWWKQT